jgi:hypothetical protein
MLIFETPAAVTSAENSRSPRLFTASGVPSTSAAPSASLGRLLGEHEAEVLVRVPISHLQRGLVGLVRLQQIHSLRGDFDRAGAFPFRRGEHRLDAAGQELPPDLHATTGYVQIAPEQARELGFAHPGIDRERVERRRLRAGRLRDRQKGRRLLTGPAIAVSCRLLRAPRIVGHVRSLIPHDQTIPTAAFNALLSTVKIFSSVAGASAAFPARNASI